METLKFIRGLPKAKRNSDNVKKLKATATGACSQLVGKEWYGSLDKAIGAAEKLIALEIRANPLISTPPSDGSEVLPRRMASTQVEVKWASNATIPVHFYHPLRKDKDGIAVTAQAGSATKVESGTFGPGGLATITIQLKDLGDLSKGGFVTLSHLSSLPHVVRVLPEKKP